MRIIFQVTALLATLESQESARRKGHFALYNCLVLGHTKYSGVQRVYCNPFPAKTFHASHRMDFVMIQPPGIDNGVSPDRQLASLTGQCRQVYCLVEMAPSAPSWRPPHQRGEFDGFPGRREGPNQCRHTRSFQAFSTYPVLRRSRRRRIAPSDPSLNQPSRQSPAACPEWPNSSRTFTNLNNSLNREPNE